MSIAKQTKNMMLKKYNGRCAYCGCELRRGSVTVDHVVPKSKGGTLSNNNTKPSCIICNKLKASMSLDEFRNHLMREVRNKTKNAAAIQKKYKFKNGKVTFFFEKCDDEYYSKLRRMEKIFSQIRKEKHDD